MRSSLLPGVTSVACAIFAALLGAGCGPSDAPGLTDSAPSPAAEHDVEGLDIGPPVLCADPTVGFDRLVDRTAESGLGDWLPEPSDMVRAIPLVAHDLDGDGDLDLAHGRAVGQPRILLNDGAGHFVPAAELEGLGDLGPSDARALGAGDFDGDGLPELMVVALGGLYVFPNLGDAEWGDPDVVPLLVDGVDIIPMTMTQADLDGDGDLDVVVGTALRAGDVPAGPDEPPAAVAELVLLNDGGGLTIAGTLLPFAGDPMLGQLVLATDRDNDGDLDLLVGGDRGAQFGPNAFFRNDGPPPGAPEYVDDAPSVEADLVMSVMGAASADLDGDGLLDYLMSDTGPVVCLLSAGGADFVEGGAALGLAMHDYFQPSDWTGWSLDLDDLDGDGLLDLIVAGGAHADLLEGSHQPPIDEIPPYPNGLWRGLPDGTWELRGAEVGFDSTADDFGLAAADFDGDGYSEIAIAGLSGLSYWDNPCGAGAWVEVDLDGLPGNREGFGARVELTADGVEQVREIYGVRTLGQGPSSVRFSLGDADSVDRLAVLWPDGTESVAIDLPVRRRITVLHPDRAD